MTLILTGRPRRRRASLEACSSESFAPAMTTYSTVIGCRASAGQERSAWNRPASGYERLIGMSRLRVSSSGALTDTARLGRRSHEAIFESAGVMPDVETVTRRG